LPGQIRELAVRDIYKAIALAERGVKFDELQELFHFYYWHYDQQQGVLAGKKSAIYEWFEKNTTMKPKAPEPEFFKHFTPKSFEPLAKIFVEAVNKRDYRKIMSLAMAIKFLKEFDLARADKYRAAILKCKLVADRKNEIWTAEKLADEIRWPGRDGDGMRQLRRLADELKFPRTKRVKKMS
jgi:hypothetical protein